MRKAVSILGANIKRLCEQKGKTQSWLAEQMEIQPQTLSRIVCGADPRVSTCQRIADVFQIGLDELMLPPPLP